MRRLSFLFIISIVSTILVAIITINSFNFPIEIPEKTLEKLMFWTTKEIMFLV